MPQRTESPTPRSVSMEASQEPLRYKEDELLGWWPHHDQTHSPSPPFFCLHGNWVAFSSFRAYTHLCFLISPTPPSPDLPSLNK